MRLQAEDTTEQAEQVLIQLLRDATPTRRAGRARALSQTVIRLGRRALRRQNPALSELELKLMFVALHYGSDTAQRVRAALEQREATRG